MTAPDNHHFLPVFYLSRWQREAGLIEFARRGNGKIEGRKTYPRGTGYKPGLYSHRYEEDPLKAQALEIKFMQGVDREASECLAQMEKEQVFQSSLGQRSAWSRFIMSLLQRTPEEMETFRKNYAEGFYTFTPEQQARYEKNKSRDDPPTLSEYAAQRPWIAEGGALRTIQTLIDHDGVGQTINGMVWMTLQTPASNFEFLTSDRPVLMSPTLKDENAYIILPVGPRRLFAAAKDQNTMDLLRAKSDTELVKIVNAQTVSHAVKFAYGSDGSQLRFVQNHLSTRKFESLFERIYKHRKSKS